MLETLAETSSFDAVEGGIDVFVCLSFLPVGIECLHVDCFAHNVLDLIAAPGLLDVGRKGPLADAPVLNGAGAAAVSVAFFAVVAPEKGKKRHNGG